MSPHALSYTDAQGRFSARVRGHGRIPVAVDVDAAATRLGRARTTGEWHADVDLAAPPALLRFELAGADPEL